MRIGIIGGGVVGQATARSYLEHVEEVRIYDLDKFRATHSLGETLFSDLIFLCLPTPQSKIDLECDISVIENVCRQIREIEAQGAGNYVLRSTVPIGTTRMLAEKYGLKNLVHSPEFLTARCASVDAQIPARNIIGMPDRYVRMQEEVIGPDGSKTTVNYPTQTCYRVLRRLYEERFPGIPLYAMSSDESEAVKLFTNAFFAVKVSFFNEIHAFAKAKGLNWKTVLEGILSDGRISHSHTNVPGPDGRCGFGGTCLPKDLASLISQIHELGNKMEDDSIWPHILGGVYDRNDADRNRKP